MQTIAKSIAVWLVVAALMLNPIAAMGGECKEPVELFLGDTAPCHGQLLSDIQAAKGAYWVEMGPKWKSAYLKSRQDALILMEPTPPPPIEWYAHPAFWGVTMLLVGFAVGIGIKFGLDI